MMDESEGRPRAQRVNRSHTSYVRLTPCSLKEQYENTSVHNVPGQLRDSALFEGSEASPAGHSNHRRIKLELSMEHPWNDTDMRKARCLEKSLFLYHLVKHKSHTDWPGIEP